MAPQAQQTPAKPPEPSKVPNLTTNPADSAVSVAAAGPASKKLSQLMGEIVTRIMDDRTSMSVCINQLKMWVDAQDLDNRAEILSQAKRDMELVKLIGEALYGEFIKISQTY